MSLDRSLHMIYGYRVEGSKLEDDIEKYLDEKGVYPNGQDECDFYDYIHNRNEKNEVYIVTDSMCGEFSILGLSIINEDIYNDVEFSFDNPQEIIDLCDDELLDKGIREKLPFIVGKEYDEAGLLYGELPKLYIFTLTR